MTLADYIILEDRVVKFGKQVGPHYGQCVVLAGGAGSGKGYITKHYFGTEFKIFDVDELKKMYMKMQAKSLIDDKKEYDLKNTDDVSSLHYKVRDCGSIPPSSTKTRIKTGSEY